MAECDGYFSAHGISFHPDQQDIAVRTVLADDFYDPIYKKWLIQCWFDVTYGSWNGSRFDLRDSRAKMSNYLESTTYRTFEELIQAPHAKED